MFILGKIGKAKKSLWRMPRHQEPKKDVQVCENLRGADKEPTEPQESEWGNPPRAIPWNPYMNK